MGGWLALPPLRRRRGRFDEGDGLQKVIPRRKDQEGCGSGDHVEELAARTGFLARQAPEIVHYFAKSVSGKGKQV